ncbi:MAG TPA: RNA polymerase sigma factor [Polyangiaceae bacterium]
MSSFDVRLINVREPGGAQAPGRMPARAVPDFATLYDVWFDHVARWLKALGAPERDHEDLAQEVFLVVRRRLPEFDGHNVAGWLFQISRRQVLRYRRLRWVQRVLTFGSSEHVEQIPELRHSPLAALENKQRHELVQQLVAKLSDKRRVVFVLFEVEGYSGEEIADLLDTPLNTVWTRLHHARKDFCELYARYKRTEGGGERWNG